MHAVKSSGSEGEALFDRYFRTYGFDVAETHTSASTVAATRSLKLDVASTSSYVELKTRSDLEKVRWFIWTYCCASALRDAAFLRLFYRYGFSRINIVRGVAHGFGAEKDVRFDRLLRTQLAQALVLDAHINNPRFGLKVWHEAANTVAGTKYSDTINWPAIDAEHEYKIVAEIVRRRRMPGAMTDEAQRSAFIVLCAKGLSYAGRNGKFEQATYDAWASAHDAFLKKIGYEGGAIQLIREANKQQHPPPPPPAVPMPVSRLALVLGSTYDFLEHRRPSGS